MAHPFDLHPYDDSWKAGEDGESLPSPGVRVAVMNVDPLLIITAPRIQSEW